MPVSVLKFKQLKLIYGENRYYAKVRFYDTMKAEIDHLDFKERQYVVRQLVDIVVTDGATASVEGSLPLVISEEDTENNYGQNSINRNRGSPKRRKKYPVQRIIKKTSCQRCQLSFLYN